MVVNPLLAIVEVRAGKGVLGWHEVEIDYHALMIWLDQEDLLNSITQYPVTHVPQDVFLWLIYIDYSRFHSGSRHQFHQ